MMTATCTPSLFADRACRFTTRLQRSRRERPTPFAAAGKQRLSTRCYVLPVKTQRPLVLVLTGTDPSFLSDAKLDINQPCVGSATVAGLTAAGILAPVVTAGGVDANLMVLAIGAGSLALSHVNDAGFWLFKEYFNVSLADTLKSWTVMETIVSVVGLAGVLVLARII